MTPVGGQPPRFEFSDRFEHNERKFVLVTSAICVILMAACACASVAAPTVFGEFYPAMATNFVIIFLAEVAWRALLSCVAYRYADRYKRTLNYTRKLGNCFRLFKLFVFGISRCTVRVGSAPAWPLTLYPPKPLNQATSSQVCETSQSPSSLHSALTNCSTSSCSPTT